jgi:hypothetical protein
MEESGKMRRCCQDICALWHYESYATMSGGKKEREIYDKSRKIIVFLPAEGLI